MLMRNLGHQIDRRSDIRVILNIAAVTRGIRAVIPSGKLADHLGKRQSGYIATYTGVHTCNILHQRIELRRRYPNAQISIFRDLIVDLIIFILGHLRGIEHTGRQHTDGDEILLHPPR